jgi:hypothetical protein
MDAHRLDELMALGFGCALAGDFQAALRHYAEILQQHPDIGMVHYSAGQLLLAEGHYQQGWAECEWRPPQTTFPPFIKRWQGEFLDGASILIAGEQGFGDNLQFVRYAPMVAERGGRVIVGTREGLGRLMSTAPGVEQVVEAGQPLPRLSHYVPMLSLPYIFDTTEDTIPQDIPYISADPERVAHWRERLAWADDGPRVGLVWAGNADFLSDERRSPGFESYRALFQVPGITFFSLQKGEGDKAAIRTDLPMNLFDLAPELTSFDETAAAIMNLDLVISSCTSPVHLAGALGKPVWVVLTDFADWRWLRDRDDSPWYPSARLFRRQIGGDWTEVLARVASELRKAFPL